MITEEIRLWDDADYAVLQTYILKDSPEYQTGRKRPAVIICPGGGYLGTTDREAEPVALRFTACGYHAFVLRYTTYYKAYSADHANPPPGNPRSRYPQPLLDLARAVQTLRLHADDWNADGDKIIVCGFSSGGHLAACLGVHWQAELIRDALKAPSEMFKPNALILGYGLFDFMIMKAKNKAKDASLELWHLSNEAMFGHAEPTDEELMDCSPVFHVTASTPPAFIWHTSDDGLVYPENALFMAAALGRHQVPYELHLFESGSGVHGLSLSDAVTAIYPGHVIPSVAVWFDLAMNWLKKRF